MDEATVRRWKKSASQIEDLVSRQAKGKERYLVCGGKFPVIDKALFHHFLIVKDLTRFQAAINVSVVLAKAVELKLNSLRSCSSVQNIKKRGLLSRREAPIPDLLAL